MNEWTVNALLASSAFLVFAVTLAEFHALRYGARAVPAFMRGWLKTAKSSDAGATIASYGDLVIAIAIELVVLGTLVFESGHLTPSRLVFFAVELAGAGAWCAYLLIRRSRDRPQGA